MEFQSNYIPERLKQKLKYCNVCKNRLSDIKYGAKCSITKKLPEFDPQCPDFKFDKEHFDFCRSQIIEENKESENLRPEVDMIYEYLEKNKIMTIVKNQDFDRKIATKSKAGLYINSFFNLLLFSIIYYAESSTKALLIEVYFFLAVEAAIILQYFLYTKSVVFDKDYIEFRSKKNLRIYWDEILAIYYHYNEDGGGVVFDLIIGDTYEFEELPSVHKISSWDFATLAEAYRCNFMKNSKLHKPS